MILTSLHLNITGTLYFLPFPSEHDRFARLGLLDPPSTKKRPATKDILIVLLSSSIRLIVHSTHGGLVTSFQTQRVTTTKNFTVMMMMNAVIKVFVLATAVISGSVALNDVRMM